MAGPPRDTRNVADILPREARRGTRGLAAGIALSVGGKRALPIALLWALLGAMLASGCVTPSRAPGDGSEAAIANDLVDAYAQTEPPLRTTLQVTGDAPEVSTALIEALVARGYGVQRVSGDEGARLIGWRLEAEDGTGTQVRNAGRLGGGERRIARLEIGPMTFERRYSLDGGRVAPIGPLQVAGTRAPIVLDDGDYGTLPTGVSEVRYTVVDAPLDTPLISLVTEEVVADVTRQATGRAVNSARIEVDNLAFGTSAFGSLRASLEEVAREVVVFPNDSMRLGSDGKRQVAAFADAFRENSDMIGLIGCSNGPTALAIGNEGLALGRSERVADELVALGIDRAKIIDEGCWSESSMGERFPARGVVIELLRRKI